MLKSLKLTEFQCPERSSTFRIIYEMFAAVSLQDLGLATVWDDHLSYVLTPALSAYETERLTGLLDCCRSG